MRRRSSNNVHMVLMLSSMLHSIGVGNMLPSWVRVVCVDINPAVVTKLSDRGSQQTVGVVTDVGLFLHRLAEALRLNRTGSDPSRNFDSVEFRFWILHSGHTTALAVGARSIRHSPTRASACSRLPRVRGVPETQTHGPRLLESRRRTRTTRSGRRLEHAPARRIPLTTTAQAAVSQMCGLDGWVWYRWPFSTRLAIA